ncbi:hypothetical protein CAJAP_07404 [Camponotus japonicus]
MRRQREMVPYLLLNLLLIVSLISLTNAGGHGGGHKHVVIHVPYQVKTIHHTHTITKHIHHKDGGGDKYEVLGYTVGHPIDLGGHGGGGHDFGGSSGGYDFGGSSGGHDFGGSSGGHDFGGSSGGHDFGGSSGGHDFGGSSGGHDFGGSSGGHDFGGSSGGHNFVGGGGGGHDFGGGFGGGGHEGWSSR